MPQKIPQSIPPSLWDKIFSRGKVCSVCGDVTSEAGPSGVINEEKHVKLHDALVHEACLRNNLGDALI